MKIYTLNSAGRANVLDQLTDRLKTAPSDRALDAWCAELQESIQAYPDNMWEIEIASRYTKSGHPEFLRAREADVTVTVEADEE